LIGNSTTIYRHKERSAFGESALADGVDGNASERVFLICREERCTNVISEILKSGYAWRLFKKDAFLTGGRK